MLLQDLFIKYGLDINVLFRDTFETRNTMKAKKSSEQSVEEDPSSHSFQKKNVFTIEWEGKCNVENLKKYSIESRGDVMGIVIICKNTLTVMDEKSTHLNLIDFYESPFTVACGKKCNIKNINNKYIKCYIANCIISQLLQINVVMSSWDDYSWSGKKYNECEIANIIYKKLLTVLSKITP